MKHRIAGFDLARAYAIFGMYIVNFNIVFGNYKDSSIAGQLLSLFSGNSSTLFVVLAGLGASLMSKSKQAAPAHEKSQLQTVVGRRGWFLFFLGLALYSWWPADILHFYGTYMHIAALLLFVRKQVYIYVSVAAVTIFHVLLMIIPYESGWDFQTLQYKDFWTISGFLRNTFYNGWNPVFPWLAYFGVGMYLGRLDWTVASTRHRIFGVGLALFAAILAVQMLAKNQAIDAELMIFLTADYLPPFLTFIVGTLGFALMAISVFAWLGQFIKRSKLLECLAKTGQMTLTHYLSHLTIGMLMLAYLGDRTYAPQPTDQPALSPIFILGFSAGYFIVSCCFSWLWLSKYRYGPLETLMRKIAG